jgi:protein-L-isoaspartate O-methyltransferase
VGESQGAAEQTLVRVTRRGSEFVREAAGSCRFVPLVGKFGF